jgi:hypothetical protein
MDTIKEDFHTLESDVMELITGHKRFGRPVENVYLGRYEIMLINKYCNKYYPHQGPVGDSKETIFGITLYKVAVESHIGVS